MIIGHLIDGKDTITQYFIYSNFNRNAIIPNNNNKIIVDNTMIFDTLLKEQAFLVKAFGAEIEQNYNHYYQFIERKYSKNKYINTLYHH